MKRIIFCLLLSVCAGTLLSMTPDERIAYLQWMKQTLPEVPEWTAWQQKTGELPPDFDQLPRTNLLPDPLRFLDGRSVKNNAIDWSARREEIRHLFEKYMIGTFPPKATITRVVPTSESRGSGYLTGDVRIEFGPQGKGSVRVRLVIPDGTAGSKFPVLICPNLAGWGPSLIRRGYISAGFAGNDMMDDAAALKDLYPDYDFATLGRRAWLVKVVLDYLETIPQVDMKRVAIFGYSRDGKMATIAAAMDDRIAALVAGSTGVGGLLPWRLSGERGGGESIESTTRMFPGWFVPRLRFFAGREDRLPVDANLFLALIAPRAVLMEWGHNDEVTNGWGIEQAYASARKVYDRLGQPNRMGLLHVPGFHGSNDQEACIDWLDSQFGKTSKTWVNDFAFPWDYDKWYSTTGKTISLNKYLKPAVTATTVSTLNDWEAQVPGLRGSIEWVMGVTPPFMPATSGGFPMRGAGNTGPTEIAKGQIGNPGQLAPDVPSWVIARGSAEFGWTAADNKLVNSRRIRFGSGVTGDLYYPANTPEGTKLPTVIWLHGFHQSLGYMWVYRRDQHLILALAKAGYAVLAFDQTGYGMRWNEAKPFYDRYPEWSRLGKMVEDVRGAVDALQKDALVDASRISVVGYTLGGTVGLYAAALDERIAGVVSICGFTPMRTDTQDKGTSGMTRYSHQHGLLPRLGLFAGKEATLPYDYDDMMALVAPRPVLVVQPQKDRDASPGEVRAAVARAGNIFTLKGVPGKIGLMEPDDYARLTAATQDHVIEWMKKNF
ncbi:MAG: alpha/beta fold hydrolase [Bacteroidota bacterium]|nr:alpha/beta fold hydrolase [Bacteroidota bacterium]